MTSLCRCARLESINRRHGRHYKPLGAGQVQQRLPLTFLVHEADAHLRKGTHEYFKRLTLFSEHLQKAEVINSRPGQASRLLAFGLACFSRERAMPGHLWIAGVGPLSDLTPED